MPDAARERRRTGSTSSIVGGGWRRQASASGPSDIDSRTLSPPAPEQADAGIRTRDPHFTREVLPQGVFPANRALLMSETYLWGAHPRSDAALSRGFDRLAMDRLIGPATGDRV